MVRFIIFLVLLLLCFGENTAQDLADYKLKVDSLVQDAIEAKAFPGAQVLIRYKDSILINKSYGFHTYEKVTPVKKDHLYDLASLSKVIAGGLAVMKLQDQGLFDPSMKLSETDEYFKNSDKESITWQDILAHQSRMKPYIIFWQTAKRKNGKNYKWRTFSYKQNRYNSIQIDQDIFLHRRYPRTMRKLIKDSELKSDYDYLYSGLGFLLIPDLVLSKTGKTLDHYLADEIYNPLGLSRLTFNPTKTFSKKEIVPTEIDTFFRHKLVHGYVHDENASMLNGVSANAGLFANAESLGEIASLLLDTNNQLINPEIIKQYTSVQFPENKNRRGLAFDKPTSNNSSPNTYIASSASPESFGHSGFTGTFIWIDPTYELTVIFLSNRVHPDRSNRKLYSSDFRPKLHQSAYDYIEKIKK